MILNLQPQVLGPIPIQYVSTNEGGLNSTLVLSDFLKPVAGPPFPPAPTSLLPKPMMWPGNPAPCYYCPLDPFSWALALRPSIGLRRDFELKLVKVPLAHVCHMLPLIEPAGSAGSGRECGNLGQVLLFGRCKCCDCVGGVHGSVSGYA
jgi:hypothetical protein